MYMGKFGPTSLIFGLQGNSSILLASFFWTPCICQNICLCIYVRLPRPRPRLFREPCLPIPLIDCQKGHMCLWQLYSAWKKLRSKHQWLFDILAFFFTGLNNVIGYQRRSISGMFHNKWEIMRINFSVALQIRSIERQSDLLIYVVALAKKGLTKPATQNIIVKMREMVGNNTRLVSLMVMVPFLGSISSSELSSDLTLITPTLLSRPGTVFFIISFAVCITTSRKGIVMVKSIQMSIILM